MDVLDGSFLSQCNDFPPSFASVNPINNANTSTYLQSTTAPATNPMFNMDNLNLFSTPPMKTEPDTGTSNGHFPQDFTQSTSTASTPTAPNDLSLAKGHACEVCHKIFADRNLLSKHKIAHAEAKHICNTCGRAFVREDKLRRHIRCVHSSERPYVCEVCAKAFARKDKLQEHAKHHNKDITFPCPACSEVFLMRSILNRHLRNVHQIRPNTDQAFKVAPLKTTQADNIPQSSSNSVSGSKKKRQKVSDHQFQGTPNVDNSATAAAAAAAQYYQSAGGWNAANLLLYNRYQQQQGQHQQQQFDWAGAASAPCGNGYFYPSHASGYQFPATAQYAASAMRHQQQQATHPAAGAAFNAAMAARLFSPANYWWPQAGQNFVFQQPAQYNVNLPASGTVVPTESSPATVSPTASTTTAATDTAIAMPIAAMRMKLDPSSAATSTAALDYNNTSPLPSAFTAAPESRRRASPPTAAGQPGTASTTDTTQFTTVGPYHHQQQYHHHQPVTAANTTATTDAQSPVTSAATAAPNYSTN